MDADEILDGLALWDEHKPQSGDDWVKVAERFIAAGETTEHSSPLFAAVVQAVRERLAAEPRAVGTRCGPTIEPASSKADRGRRTGHAPLRGLPAALDGDPSRDESTPAYRPGSRRTVMSDPLNKGEWPEGTDWSFHVHDDGLYASINDGVRGDTLLRIGGQPGPPGSIDQAKVEAFADDYRRRIPLSSIRERLEADGAEAMARKEYELHQEEMGYETVWEEETQGHRNIWLDAARARLDLALDAALPLICHRCNKRAAMDAFKVCWECMGSSGSAALPPSKNEDEKT